jgi:hypothetical protein
MARQILVKLSNNKLRKNNFSGSGVLIHKAILFGDPKMHRRA